MARKQEQKSNAGGRLIIALVLLFGLLMVASVIALFLGGGDSYDLGGNVAVIRIIGPIAGDSAGGVFDPGVASSTDIVDLLEEARDDDSIMGVMIEINSPGGSAVASDEIGQAIKDVRASGKPVVAWIREVGASGGYWIASSTDHVVANRMSITGSIGVYGSYLSFEEFLDDWNVTQNRLVSGDRKDIGDPFTELSPSDRAYLQARMDRIHGFFIQEVAENRNMTEAQVARIADGGFLLGVEALDAGLVDELGGEEEALLWMDEAIGTTSVPVVFEHDEGLFDALFGTESAVSELGWLKADVPLPMLR